MLSPPDYQRLLSQKNCEKPGKIALNGSARRRAGYNSGHTRDI
jgi:hypothetical protein